MSNISVIYDKLREIIPTIVTGRVELVNPYDIVNNPRPFLQSGWGLVIGEGSPSEIDIMCRDYESRIFTIVLTDNLITLGNTHEAMSVASKAMIENIRLLKDRLIEFDQLGIDSNIEQIRFVSSSGIEFLNSEEVSYLISSITVLVDFSEII